MTPGVRVHVVMPPSLVEGVDAARAEGQSRGDWVRRAVERALEANVEAESSPAPAEQPESDSPYAAHLTSGGMRAVPKKDLENAARMASPPEPIPPRVPFRRDVKPFQRGDK